MKTNLLNVLLIGSGGREYALARKIASSALLNHLYAVDSSDSIYSKFTNNKSGSEIDGDDHAAIVKFCKHNAIDLVVIGPEKYLFNGLSDALVSNDIKTFGPSKDGAQIETSKIFGKEICQEAGIKTSAYEKFSNIDDAKHYINKSNESIFVLKYDGLANGKGVIISKTKDKAIEAANELFTKYAGNILIEEYIDGHELSFFALTDGETVKKLCYARDYKRAYDGDNGDNTGGMGAYSSDDLISEKMSAHIMEKIMKPLVNTLSNKKISYNGVIFAGLMFPRAGHENAYDNEPYIIEFNARFGDPECQVICERLETDLLEILYSTASAKLKDIQISIKKDPAMCVVIAANGYPHDYVTNSKIEASALESDGSKTYIVQNATKIDSNNNITSVGGRVLSVVCSAKDLPALRLQIYDRIKKINWSDGFYRSDIGL